MYVGLYFTINQVLCWFFFVAFVLPVMQVAKCMFHEKSIFDSIKRSYRFSVWKHLLGCFKFSRRGSGGHQTFQLLTPLPSISVIRYGQVAHSIWCSLIWNDMWHESTKTWKTQHVVVLFSLGDCIVHFQITRFKRIGIIFRFPEWLWELMSCLL